MIIAGKEYGTGSSRDWAAKGTMLLGVRAVIAESFERIHRSNLVGMGVLPLQFQRRRECREPRPRRRRELHHHRRRRHPAAPGRRGAGDRDDGNGVSITARCRIDTYNELEYFQLGRDPPVRAAEAGGLMPRKRRSGRHLPLRPRAASRCRAGPTTSAQCNCSLCTKTGWRGVYCASAELTIEGEFDGYVREDLSEHNLASMRCASAGPPPIGTPLTAPPHERMGVNARLIDPAALDGVRVQPVDGRSWGADAHGNRRRGRRLGGRGADPARLLAAVCGKLTASRSAYQGMNMVGAAGFIINGWWHGASAVGGAQRRMDGDRSNRVMADLRQRGSSTSAM